METPDTQTIAWDSAAGKSTVREGRSCNNYPVDGIDCGTAFLNWKNYTIYDNKRKIIKEVKAGQKNDTANLLSSIEIEPDALHVINFPGAIRTGAKMNSPLRRPIAA